MDVGDSRNEMTKEEGMEEEGFSGANITSDISSNTLRKKWRNRPVIFPRNYMYV